MFLARLFKILGSLVFALFAMPALAQQSWTRIGQDLDMLRQPVSGAAIFSAEFVALRTSLNSYKLVVLRAEEFGQKQMDAKRICERSGASVCINANFFDENGDALGLVVSRGTVYHKPHNSGRTLTGILQLAHGQVSIIPRTAYQAGLALEAIQAGPRIIESGRPIESNDLSSSRRSGACLDSKRNLIVYVTDSAFSGVSVKALQNALLAQPFECQEAINLDGGGSAQLYMSNKIPGASSGLQEVFITPRDKVPVMLGLLKR